MTTRGEARPAREPLSGEAGPVTDDMALALIAHDGKKADLVAWATYNRDRLAAFPIVATATTGALLREKVGLPVTTLLSGPMGGDAQIAALVVEGRIHAVFFFVDPLSAHPHDPDIRYRHARLQCPQRAHRDERRGRRPVPVRHLSAIDERRGLTDRHRPWATRPRAGAAFWSCPCCARAVNRNEAIPARTASRATSPVPGVAAAAPGAHLGPRPPPGPDARGRTASPR